MELRQPRFDRRVYCNHFLDSMGKLFMSVAHGFGMLAVGLFVLLIGVFVAHYIINNHIVPNKKEKDDKWI